MDSVSKEKDIKLGFLHGIPSMAREQPKGPDRLTHLTVGLICHCAGDDKLRTAVNLTEIAANKDSLSGNFLLIT